MYSSIIQVHAVYYLRWFLYFFNEKSAVKQNHGECCRKIFEGTGCREGALLTRSSPSCTRTRRAAANATWWTGWGWRGDRQSRVSLALSSTAPPSSQWASWSSRDVPPQRTSPGSREGWSGGHIPRTPLDWEARWPGGRRPRRVRASPLASWKAAAWWSSHPLSLQCCGCRCCESRAPGSCLYLRR